MKKQPGRSQNQETETLERRKEPLVILQSREIKPVESQKKQLGALPDEEINLVITFSDHNFREDNSDVEQVAARIVADIKEIRAQAEKQKIEDEKPGIVEITLIITSYLNRFNLEIYGYTAKEAEGITKCRSLRLEAKINELLESESGLKFSIVQWQDILAGEKYQIVHDEVNIRYDNKHSLNFKNATNKFVTRQVQNCKERIKAECLLVMHEEEGNNCINVSWLEQTYRNKNRNVAVFVRKSDGWHVGLLIFKGKSYLLRLESFVRAKKARRGVAEMLNEKILGGQLADGQDSSAFDFILSRLFSDHFKNIAEKPEEKSREYVLEEAAVQVTLGDNSDEVAVADKVLAFGGAGKRMSFEIYLEKQGKRPPYFNYLRNEFGFTSSKSMLELSFKIKKQTQQRRSSLDSPSSSLSADSGGLQPTVRSPDGGGRGAANLNKKNSNKKLPSTHESAKDRRQKDIKHATKNEGKHSDVNLDKKNSNNSRSNTNESKKDMERALKHLVGLSTALANGGINRLHTWYFNVNVLEKEQEGEMGSKLRLHGRAIEDLYKLFYGANAPGEVSPTEKGIEKPQLGQPK